MADVLTAPPDSADRLSPLVHGAIIVRLGRFLDEYVTACDAGLVCGPQTTQNDSFSAHLVEYGRQIGR